MTEEKKPKPFEDYTALEFLQFLPKGCKLYRSSYEFKELLNAFNKWLKCNDLQKYDCWLYFQFRAQDFLEKIK